VPSNPIRMPPLKPRDALSGWMLRIASATGWSQRLQKIPMLYRPLRAALIAVTGRRARRRKIVAGPLLGYEMFLGPDDRNAYLVNGHEKAIVELAGTLCQPGTGVLDVGAHVGYFSLLFSVKVGERGRVYTIEPNPGNLMKIRAMVEANQLRNITVFPFAASDAAGEVQFITESTGQMGHILDAASSKERSGVVTVQSVRIDDLDRQHGFGKIDLIKMDIEGAEAKALEGMKDLIGRSKPIIICEWHPAVAGSDYQARFQRLGYTCELLELPSLTEPFHVLARPGVKL
jgi:FkbM family methyltransferase